MRNAEEVDWRDVLDCTHPFALLSRPGCTPRDTTMGLRSTLGRRFNHDAVRVACALKFRYMQDSQGAEVLALERSASRLCRKWWGLDECANLRPATIGTVQSSSERITMGVDSGAEVTVWPPELFPEVATVESEESRRGMRYFGQETKSHQHVSILANVNSLKVGHLLRNANVNVVPVQKPLLALCSLSGHDVYFARDAGCSVIRTETREEIEVHRRGEKFEMDPIPPRYPRRAHGRAGGGETLDARGRGIPPMMAKQS